jgi:hypothetical protein
MLVQHVIGGILFLVIVKIRLDPEIFPPVCLFVRLMKASARAQHSRRTAGKTGDKATKLQSTVWYIRRP